MYLKGVNIKVMLLIIIGVLFWVLYWSVFEEGYYWMDWGVN